MTSYLLWLCVLGHVVCTFGGVIGSNLSSLSGCFTNEECGERLACVDLKCQDPCPGICRNNATCEVRNHVAYCACDPGLSGSPFTGCYQDVVVPTPQPYTSSAQCPTSAPTVEPRCKKDYLFVSKEVNWLEAINACRKLGRELLTVHDQAEWDVVKKAIFLVDLQAPPANYWLGGTNLYDDKWVWISDWTPFTFTRWEEGQPNNAGNNQHCLYIMKENRWWDDHDWFSGKAHYICEKCVD